MAVTSILLGNGLSGFMPSEEDPNNPVDAQVQENYNHAAIQIAFIAGCFYFAFGLFRMGERGALESVQGLKFATATTAFKCDCWSAGWITNFLSSAMISGFMSGASVIIALSQASTSWAGVAPQEEDRHCFTSAQGKTWKTRALTTSQLAPLPL